MSQCRENSASQGRPQTRSALRRRVDLIRVVCTAGVLSAIFAYGAGFSAAQVRAAEVAESSAEVLTSAHEVQRRHPREHSYIKRRWGIEIEFVRQTAAGYMLEFRYRVVDAAQAAPLFDRMSKPVLTHVESGAGLVVPTPAKTGALRNSNVPIEGRSYWMFFANPGRLVQTGEHVSIQIGEFEVRNLIVQ